jgi:predicted SprT family Zn-dependent metalloprotease
MRLSRQKLQAIYLALRLFPPFQKYKLPTDVRFRVSRSVQMCGEYFRNCKGHEIVVSSESCHTLLEVTETIAHEMVHMILERKGESDHHAHDAKFNALASEVCNTLGFDFTKF